MPDTAAPSAPSAQPISPLPDMPRSVLVAACLLWFNFALGVLYAGLFLPQGPRVTTWLLVISMAIIAMFILLLSAGYGWVRHVWSALFLFTLVFIIRNVAVTFAISPLAGTVDALGNLCTAVALSLLYVPASRAWFRAARLRRQSGL